MERYELAFNQIMKSEFTLFAAGRTKVDMIRYQLNIDGARYFKRTNDTFILDVEPSNTTANQLYIGESADYLTIKSQSQPNIFMIAMC